MENSGQRRGVLDLSGACLLSACLFNLALFVSVFACLTPPMPNPSDQDSPRPPSQPACLSDTAHPRSKLANPIKTARADKRRRSDATALASVCLAGDSQTRLSPLSSLHLSSKLVGRNSFVLTKAACCRNIEIVLHTTTLNYIYIYSSKLLPVVHFFNPSRKMP